MVAAAADLVVDSGLLFGKMSQSCKEADFSLLACKAHKQIELQHWNRSERIIGPQSVAFSLALGSGRMDMRAHSCASI